MRIHRLAGLVGLAFISSACSDQKDGSEVNPGTGDDGGAGSSRGGSSAAAGSGPALGGTVSTGDAGTSGTGEELPDLPSEVNVIICRPPWLGSMRSRLQTVLRYSR